MLFTENNFNFVTNELIKNFTENDCNNNNKQQETYQIISDSYLNQRFLNEFILNDNCFLREMASISRTNYSIVSSDLELAILKTIFPFKRNDFHYFPFFYELKNKKMKPETKKTQIQIV